MKKLTVTAVSIIVILAGAWYALSNSETSQSAKIAQIASSTEAQIQGYATSTREGLRQELKQWRIDQVVDNTKAVEIFGLSFNSPWGEPVSVDNRGSIASMSFGGNRSILIFNPSKPSQSPRKNLEELGSDMPVESISPNEAFNQSLGKNYSLYEYWKYILSTTPNKISNASTVKSATARSYAITLLATSPLSYGKPYEFSNRSARGFIVKRSDSVKILGWTANNNQRFSLTLSSNSDSEHISGKEINTVIDSIRFSSPQSDQADEINNTDNYFAN